jgi:hypothetical protein
MSRTASVGLQTVFDPAFEDLTKALGTRDYSKPGWTLNVISNATVNFVFNVIVGPASIDAYEIQKAVPAGYTIGDIGSNFYQILTKTEREKLAFLFREIVVEFGDSGFSFAEEKFFNFMSEAAKFIAGTAINRANTTSG